ncbi:MAG: hypothetical protein K8L97_30430 [Anaerolineae bacterium]|nr:hypothetical protein [Anaerolineae bacterium]
MSMFFLAIGILLFIAVTYIILHELILLRSSRSQSRSFTGYKPSKRAVTREADFQVTHKGKGTSITEAMYLDTAIYRITYQFPNNAKVKLYLVSTDGTIEKIVVEKAGYGTATFNVQIAKHYVFRVETSAEDGEWAIILKRF